MSTINTPTAAINHEAQCNKYHRLGESLKQILQFKIIIQANITQNHWRN